MRVMLGGNPQLFAPPELELLSFNTLAERLKPLPERFSFWREGTHSSADGDQAMRRRRSHSA